jgi:DNA-binding GntR family transcriptional regulator
VSRSAPLRAIRPAKTRGQEVTDQLRAAIQSGELKAGTPLTQTEIAKELGISTTPVREAFAVLMREGLLLGDPHRGAVVFHPTLADLRENYEMRVCLESLATEIAVPNLSDKDLKDLDGLLVRMGRTRRSVDYLPLNHEFHLRLYRAAGRPRLLATIEDLREAARGYAKLFAIGEADATRTQHEHEAIVDGCRRGDVSDAGEAMRRHLQHTWEVTARQVSERG